MQPLYIEGLGSLCERRLRSMLFATVIIVDEFVSGTWPSSPTLLEKKGAPALVQHDQSDPSSSAMAPSMPPF